MAKKVSIKVKNVKVTAPAATTNNEQLSFDEVEATPVTAKAVKKVIPVKSDSESTGKKTPKIKVTKTGPALVIPTKKYEPSETVLNTLELAKEMGADLNSPLYQLPKRTKDFNVDELGLEVKSFSEMKVLIKAFYNSFQSERIAAENQQRSLEQGASEGELADIDTDILDDDTQFLRYPTYAYIVEMKQEAEKQLQKLIESYVVSTKIGQYLTSIVGIGPLLAGSLMAYIDLSKAKYAGQVWSYAGLNDNNDPWLSEEKVKKVMDKVVGSSKEITDDMIVQIAILTGRSAKRIKKGATKIDEDGNETITPASLGSYLKKPPYNRSFKTVCWKMGQSVLKHKNSEKSLYGKLLNERLLYEKQKNADHGYILEALKNMGYIDKKPENMSKEDQEALLEQMHKDIESGAFVPKLGKTTQIYKTYYDGYLGDAHINARVRRWVVKLMLSHIFEAMYIDANGTFPPAPYIVSVGGHADYIYPEVRYSEFWNISDEEIAKRALELHQDKGFKFKI